MLYTCFIAYLFIAPVNPPSRYFPPWSICNCNDFFKLGNLPNKKSLCISSPRPISLVIWSFHLAVRIYYLIPNLKNLFTYFIYCSLWHFRHFLALTVCSPMMKDHLTLHVCFSAWCSRCCIFFSHFFICIFYMYGWT